MQAMKTCWGVKVEFTLSFTLKVDGCDWLASGTSRFSARKTAQVILYIEGQVGATSIFSMWGRSKIFVPAGNWTQITWLSSP